MFPRIRPLPILLALSVCPILAAQTPDANQRPVIHATSREVLLDLVARDKHHHAVTDLRPEEVEVYEDGVRQKILVFRNVQCAEQLQTERSAAQGGSSGGAAHPELARSLNSLGEINFVSIVFSQIAPLNLEFARQAVLEFLKNDNFPNTYVTVYKLSHSLKIVQVYTNDKDSLVKAVNSAAKGLYANQGFGVTAEVTGGANAQVQATVANIVAASSSSPSMIVNAENVALNPLPAIVTDPLWARNAASQDA